MKRMLICLVVLLMPAAARASDAVKKIDEILHEIDRCRARVGCTREDIDKLRVQLLQARDAAIAESKALKAVSETEVQDEKDALGEAIDRANVEDLAEVPPSEPRRIIETYDRDDSLLNDCEKTNGRHDCADERDNLISSERNLRNLAVADQGAMRDDAEKMKSGDLAANEYAAASNDLAERKARLKLIQARITVPDPDAIYHTFYDDQAWLQQFYGGIEFSNVDTLLSNGHARIGYVNSFRSRPFPPENHPSAGFGWYPWFLQLRAQLTSSAETDLTALSNKSSVPPIARSFANGDGNNDNGETENPDNRKVTKALESELAFWYPIWRTTKVDRLRHYGGPILVAGVTHAENLPHVDTRFYAGFHLGFARDAWSDFLIGKTKSLHRRRIEVRGEIPLMKFGGSGRLLLGSISNIGYGKKRNARADDAVERDVFRLYLAYEADFGKLFGLSK